MNFVILISKLNMDSNFRFISNFLKSVLILYIIEGLYLQNNVRSEAHKQKIIDVDKNELVVVNVQLSQEKKIYKPKARSKFVKPLKVGKIIIFPITLWTE